MALIVLPNAKFRIEMTENILNPPFSQAFYCGGGSAHVCVAPPRDATVHECQAALSFDDVENSHDQAKKLLKELNRQ
jgi:hypothetical protein